MMVSRKSKDDELVDTSHVKLAYIAGKFQITVQVSKNLCVALSSPPPDLCSRAKAKMEAIQKSGEIDLFTVYEKKLDIFWHRVAKQENLDPSLPLTIVIAEGSPVLDSLEVERSSLAAHACNISIHGPLSEIRSWRLEWMIYYINHCLFLLGEDRKVNSAQIHGAWLQAASGQQISKLGIIAQTLGRPEESSAQKPYAFSANKQRQEISLTIFDLEATKKEVELAKLLELAQTATHKVTESFGSQYHLLTKDLVGRLQQAYSGPELLGIDLPLVLLAASRAGRVPVNSSISADAQSKSHLNIAVTADAMTAKIEGFSIHMYQIEGLKLTADWLKGELIRHGIDLEMAKPCWQDLINAITNESDLNGFVVARGVLGKGGTKPYLKAVDLHRIQDDSQDSQEFEGSKELREFQDRRIVMVGQLMAKVQYETAPELGKDVFGKNLACPVNQAFRLDIGDGVEERTKGRFYATFEGIPVMTRQSISVKRTLTHEGDVNLRSGHIIFDGSVEVRGSVDNGARVDVTGDLTIRGSVRNALIRCKGSLFAESGITTGEQGLLMIGKDLKCEFIENSKIRCGGSIFVKKILINSEVICGGAIKVGDNKEGLIAGGMVSSRCNVVAANLGYHQGTLTVVNLGADWKAELAVRTRISRIEKLKITQNEYRMSLREIMGRNSSQQSTEKTKERKDFYQSRLQKIRGILEKLEKHLALSQSQVNYEKDSMLLVHEKLSKNVVLNLAGHLVPISQDIAGVAVLSKNRNGSNIVPIETIIEEDRARQAQKVTELKELRKTEHKKDQ